MKWRKAERNAVSPYVRVSGGKLTLLLMPILDTNTRENCPAVQICHVLSSRWGRHDDKDCVVYCLEQARRQGYKPKVAKDGGSTLSALQTSMGLISVSDMVLVNAMSSG